MLFASGAAVAAVAVATPALWHLGTAALLEVLGAVMWANREDD